MKKAKKLLIGLALTGMLLTTGCNAKKASAEPYRQQDVYQLYKAAGGKMTYQEWLATVKGADGSQIYADAGEPAASAGQDGDIYINLLDFYLYYKDNGQWKKLFCVQGPQGEQGVQGPVGPQGYQGEKGADGSNIYADAGVPSNDAGKNGDVYINIENYDIYTKLDGVWQNFGNIKGRDGVDGINGKDGAAFYCDAGVPSDEAGKDGDVYVNIENYDIYTKLDGAWVKFGNIKGEKGEKGDKGDQGVSFRTGWGKPADSMGNEEDSYLDYNSGDIYKKIFGHWCKETNFTAPLSWKDSVAKMMDRYYGFQLPYADFDPSSTIFTVTFEGSYEYLTVYDTNNYNVMSDYADKLLAAGYTYSASWDQYYKSGKLKTPWVDKFGYDDVNKANYLRIEFSPVQDEYYYLQKEGTGYLPIAEWPAANIEKAMGADFAAVVTGVDFEGYAFESFAVKNEGDEYNEYSQDLLAIEGDYVEELSAQVLAAGFIYDEDEEEFFDANHDAEIAITYSYGYTRAQFYGTYAKDWDDAYLAANFDTYEGWPSDLLVTLYPGTNIQDPNPNGNWYGSHADGSWGGTDGYLLTVGDFQAEAIECLEAAGFLYEPDWDDYELDYYSYFSVSYQRGCTVLSYHSEVELPKTAKDLKAIIEEAYDYFWEIEVEVPLFDSTNATDYAWTTQYVSSNDLFLAIAYDATPEELEAYVAKMAQAGWVACQGDYAIPDSYTMRFGSEGECPTIQMYYDEDYESVYFYCYTTFAISEITPETVTAFIANMIGGEVEDLGNGRLCVEGDYQASRVDYETLKGWCSVGVFVPQGFELVIDWEPEQVGDYDAEYCAFVYNQSIALEFYVFEVEDEEYGDMNVFLAYCQYIA